MSAETVVFITFFFLQNKQKGTLRFYDLITTGTKQSVILEMVKDRPCLCPDRPKPAAEQKKEITET